MHLLFALLTFVTTFISPVYAASLPPMVSVTPSILRLDLRTESPDTVLYYKNLSNESVDINLSAQDFNGIDDLGKVNFLQESDAKNYKYALSSWIQFQSQTLSLGPYEEKQVKIHIEKESLPVGGHYGAVLAEFVQRDENGMIPLHGMLATLVFVRAGKGYEREEGKITALNTDDPFPSFPKQFYFKFQNTGNIDVIPYGLLIITDMFGRNVAKGIVNEGSATTLPESIRRYTVTTKPRTFLLPGRYTAQLQVHYGDSKKLTGMTTTFWTEGSLPLSYVILGIIFLIITFKLYRMWKRPFK